ncbi:MAG: MFS transporter [Bacteroidota bacterium]
MNAKLWTHRIAVSAFFFVNGFLYGSWAARVPALLTYFDINKTSMGFLLLTMAAGALVSMPFSGWLTLRYGTRNITIATGLAFCVFVSQMLIFPDSRLAAGIFFLVGLSSGALDVAMNAQAILVEREWGKSIMSSFHAIFSVGMAAAGGVAYLFVQAESSLEFHLLVVSAVGFAFLIWAGLNLIKDEPASQSEEESHFRLPTKAILPLGIIAFCGMSGESSMADWSAIFMNTVAQVDEAFSTLAATSFGVAMTAGRFLGDPITDRFGRRNVLLIDSVLSVFGLSLLIVFAGPYISLLGIFLVGLGLATVVPIVYSAAGNAPGVAPGVGIAMATTVGYSGFFVGPPLIGFLADTIGIRLAFVYTLILFVVMLALVWKYIKPSSQE